MAAAAAFKNEAPEHDDDGGELEFMMPLRLEQLEDTAAALDGKFTIDALTDIAELSPSDQLATLQATFHTLAQSNAPTAIREHDLFDVLYSFVKALPEGLVVKECRALMATELSSTLHKLSRMINRLCVQYSNPNSNMDSARFEKVACICRSSVRMLTLLLQYTICAPAKHRDSDDAGPLLTSSQPTRGAGGGGRGRGKPTRRGADAENDGVDVAAKEAALTAFVECLSLSAQAIWINPRGGAPEMDEPTATCMLKVALHLLGKHGQAAAAAHEDPVMENLLFLLRALAFKFSTAYANAVALEASARPNSTGAAASPTPNATDDANESQAAPRLSATKTATIAVAHPKNVIVGPLVDLLLRTPTPTSAATTAPLPRFVSKMLALIDSEANEANAALYLAHNSDDDEEDDATFSDRRQQKQTAAASESDALNKATTWTARFVSWVLEAVAQAALSGDVTGDGTAAKNIAALIEETARNHISIIAAHAPLVMPILCSESYEARKAAITAISELIVQKYSSVSDTNEGAAARNAEMRNRYLADLIVRLRDLNPFVRSHALKTWSSLVERRAVPRHLQLRLAREAVDRVADRHFHVRRQALSLLETILRKGQWFYSTVSESLFRAKLTEHLAALDLKFASRDELLDAVKATREQMGLDGENLGSSLLQYLPTVRGTSKVEPGAAPEAADPADLARVVFYQAATEFAEMCGVALLAAVDLLASKTQFDVLQAIAFIAAASESRMDGAPHATAKMLTLVYFHEPQTQQAVCDAFLAIFFDSFNQLKGVSPQMRNLARVQKLISVIKPATEGEVSGIERILHQLRAASGQPGTRPIGAIINESFLDACFGVVDRTLDERATPEDSLAAMQLYLLCVTTLLPRDVIARKASILNAIKANAGSPRFVALALDALSKETLLRTFVPIDTSVGSRILEDPHTHAVVSVAVHELARPTVNLKQWLIVAQAACGAIHVLCSHASEVFAAAIRYVQAECENALHLGIGALPSQTKFDFSSMDRAAMIRIAQLCFLLGTSAVKHLATIDTYERAHLKQLDDASLNTANNANNTSSNSAGDAMSRELGIGGVDFKRHEIVERCAQARAAMLQSKPLPIVPNSNENDGGRNSKGSRASGRLSRGTDVNDGAQRPGGSTGTRLNTPLDTWGPLSVVIMRLCHAPWKAPPGAATNEDTASQLELLHVVRATAVTALLKLMVASETFCAQQLRLVSTLLSKPSEPWQVKTNLVIGLGDIACVHPNILAPYMKVSGNGFFALLADRDVRVRGVTVQVCTHLVLNDMLRINEHLHSIVRLISDENTTISHNAQLFVQHLATKMKHNLGNVVPPLVSALSLPSDATADLFDAASQTVESSPRANAASKARGTSVQVLPPLTHETFKLAMAPLLNALNDQKGGEKEKRAAESLVEKLCGRFPAFYSESDPVATGLARNVAFCLSELNFSSERNMKKLTCEASYAHYKQWLRDAEVLKYLLAIGAKARKPVRGAAAAAAATEANNAAGGGDGGGAGGGGDRRDRVAIEEWEQRLQADGGVLQQPSSSMQQQPSDGSMGEASSSRILYASGSQLDLDAPEERRRDSRLVTPGHGALVDQSTDEEDNAGGAAGGSDDDDGAAGRTSSNRRTAKKGRAAVKREAEDSDDDQAAAQQDDSDDASEESDDSAAIRRAAKKQKKKAKAEKSDGGAAKKKKKSKK